MTDLLDFILKNDAFQMLSTISALAAGGYELYVRRVTKRSATASALNDELDAFFKGLQEKWRSAGAGR